MRTTSLVLLIPTLLPFAILSTPHTFPRPNPSRILQKRQSTVLDQGPWTLYNITIDVADPPRPLPANSTGPTPRPAFNSSIAFTFFDPSPILGLTTYCNFTIPGPGQPVTGTGADQGYVNCENNSIGFIYYGETYPGFGWLGSIGIVYRYWTEDAGGQVWPAGAFGWWNVTPHDVWPQPEGGVRWTQACLEIYITAID
jgi:hypothetical protein